jgi:hypothetical protein
MTISQESVSIIRDEKGVITHIVINDITSRHTLIGEWNELSLEEAAELLEKGIKSPNI